MDYNSDLKHVLKIARIIITPQLSNGKLMDFEQMP